MDEFKLIAGVGIVTFVCMAAWVGGKELLTRWLHNDWCHHNWGAWETKEGNNVQLRFCRKCNMMEKRTP